jgi:hypothetical protein
MSKPRRRLARALPAPIRRRIRALGRSRPAVPPPGSVHLGDLERVTPLDRRWGSGRGRPIDRRFIEDFL